MAVTAITANTIAKALYTHCEPERNKYILHDKFVDVKHTDNALTLN